MKTFSNPSAYIYNIDLHSISCPQEVEPNSPAALAGLRPLTDYIIGADTVMNEVCGMPFFSDNSMMFSLR